MTKFTVGNIATGLAGIILLTLIVITDSTFQCPEAKDDPCKQALGTLSTLGFIIGIITVVFGTLVPYFLSLRPKDIREELADEGGPSHGTLPKDYSQNTKEKEGQS